jgi:hypothetical protein
MRSFQFLLTIAAGLLLCQASAEYCGGCDVCFSPFYLDVRLTWASHSMTASRNSTSPIATETTFIGIGPVSVMISLRSTPSTIASLHHVPPRIKTVPRPCALMSTGPHTNVAFPAIFANIAQACADQGSPITAAPAEATFSATSGGTLFASGVGHGSGSCASDGGPGDGRGHGYGHDRAGHCSWTTFTGNWGGWDVSWAGFGLDDNCSTTAGSTPTAATSPSGVSASATRTGSLSLGATVTTTINGQTLTGTIFNAQGAAVSATSGTAAVAAASGGSAGSERMGALAAIFVALLAAACML